MKHDRSFPVDGRPVSIAIEGLVKTFGTGKHAVQALERVDLEIRQNEFFTLLGPSGCGKTTLLRLIAGFESPSDGAILLDGKEIAPLPPFDRPINTVFQSYALFPHMTVAENIGFGLKMQGRPKAEVAARVADMLRLVQMEPLAHRRTSQISGGQQQRVALARALAPQPKVLLLDEPLSALDFKLRKEMQTELKRLQVETGITFIFVTHDQEEALTMSDRIAVMSRGRVLQVGTPREIYHEPSDRFVAEFVGESNFLAARVSGHDGRTVLAELGAARLRVTTDHLLSVGTDITVMIRPEHLDFLPGPATGCLSGAVTDAVFFGTDTHYRVRLDSGTEITVRGQNSAGGALGPAVGQSVWLGVQPDAARVVRG
ncbi:MAG: ABC transporter ATP-binding protein [Paracoccaceae bacterium]